MYQQQDAVHLQAMQAIQELMKIPDDMNKWFESRRREFEELSED